MPTLQQLRYLSAVAKTLNFSRAAEMCHVTQPTLSLQIKALEDRLGTRLIERTRARVLLTPAGAEIARRAETIAAEVEDIREIARRDDMTALQRDLRLGVVHTVGAYVLSVVMPQVRAAYPDTRLQVREDSAEMLVEGVLEGRYDVLILPEPPDHADLRAAVIVDEALLAVLPQGHRLAGQDAINPAALRGETVLTTDFGPAVNSAVARLCHGVGAVQASEYDGTTLDTLRQMVAAGMGMSFLPALYVRSEVAREEAVVAVALAGAPLVRGVSLVWRQSAPRGDSYSALAALMRGALAPWGAPPREDEGV
ncbi:hydrogen peroxide-inducible activator (plasmid) [Ketogulonicigenium robustum]|uniref:Hydrogen peroxide-inducible activator n=1 Tax=Ketogulonicigenium robustum TaxID=92947 RepID=A0A1W6P3P9_9RHOB|nr:LysR substrate-binding domain-containing protein [Ketogulonicigenium robustum]ARO15980.1 hydrogen peroxide-inducible activator [Ketogulonicigenium robustum]